MVSVELGRTSETSAASSGNGDYHITIIAFGVLYDAAEIAFVTTLEMSKLIEDHSDG